MISKLFPSADELKRAEGKKTTRDPFSVHQPLSKVMSPDWVPSTSQGPAFTAWRRLWGMGLSPTGSSLFSNHWSLTMNHLA